jgi:hypothetical protein
MPANNLRSCSSQRRARVAPVIREGRDASDLFAVAVSIALPASAESPPPGSYQGTCINIKGSEAARWTRQEPHRHLPEERKDG